MFDLAASDPVDLRTGDRLDVVTAIRRGDIVSLVRIEPDVVRLRYIHPAEHAEAEGVLYRIDRDTSTGRIILRQHDPE